jgi:hypothetical protein
MKKNIDKWQTATAFHLSDEQVERLVSFRLQTILNRKIAVHLDTDTDYWDIELSPPLTEPEMEMLFTYVNADANDRADHQLYQNVVSDLSAQLTTKLILADFPVPIHSTLPMTQGVCFYSAFKPFEKVYEKTPQAHGESGDRNV